jgi:hypothetical protein
VIGVVFRSTSRGRGRGSIVVMGMRDDVWLLVVVGEAVQLRDERGRSRAVVVRGCEVV